MASRILVLFIPVFLSADLIESNSESISPVKLTLYIDFGALSTSFFVMGFSMGRILQTGAVMSVRFHINPPEEDDLPLSALYICCIDIDSSLAASATDEYEQIYSPSSLYFRISCIGSDFFDFFFSPTFSCINVSGKNKSEIGNGIP